MTAEPYDPKAHLIRIKTKEGERDFLPAIQRVKWIASEKDRYTFATEVITITDDYAVVRATAATVDDAGVVVRSAQAFKRADRMVKTQKGTIEDLDYLEKADTGALGRALARLGYGTEYAAEDDGHAPAKTPTQGAGAKPPQPVTGTVETVSDAGFRLAGREAWVLYPAVWNGWRPKEGDGVKVAVKRDGERWVIASLSRATGAAAA